MKAPPLPAPAAEPLDRRDVPPGTREAGGDRRFRLWVALSATFALLLFSLFTWIRIHHNDAELFVSDGYYYYAYLPSWWIDHDVDFTNQYRHRPEESLDWGHRPTATGRPSNPFPVGMALLLSPAFLIARVVSLCRGDGWDLSYQLPVCTVAFVYSMLGVAITFALLRRLFSQRSTLVTVAALGLGTSWTAYLFCEPNMSHGIAAFTVAAFLWSLLRAAEEPELGRMAATGLLLGLAALVRTQNILLMLLLPAVLDRRHFRFYPVLADAALLVFAPQMLAWHAIYSRWLGIPQGEGFMQWTRPALFSVLFSTNHGLLMWSPLLCCSVVGFVLLGRSGVQAFRRSGQTDSVPSEGLNARMPECLNAVSAGRLRSLVVGCALVLLAELYVNSVVRDWWGGWAFGMRRMVDTMPLFAIGLAGLMTVIERRRRLRRSVLLVIAVLVVLNWCQIYRYYTHALPPVGDIGIRRLWGKVFWR